MVRTDSRRLDRSARSMVTTPAPIMLRKMKSILSLRRPRKVAKLQEVAEHAKPWGRRSCRRMQVSWLPFEIVANILSRLPVKSLLRFRCVCKEWRSLTYDPNFIKEHHTCARALGRLSLISKRYRPPKISLYDFGDNGEVRNQAFNKRCGEAFNKRFGRQLRYTISNPANGLICGYCHMNIHDDGYYYLLNPASRELAQLPTGRNGPRNGSTSLGLGFDSCTGGYKMVRLFHIDGDRDHCGCEVLEVGTSEWRDVGCAPCMLPTSQPALLNGALHWTTMRRLGGNNNPAELTIVAFNLKDEKFRLIPVPNLKVGSLLSSLVEWEGLLCLVKVHNASMERRRCLLRIWRLEEYASCRWSEAHSSYIDVWNYASKSVLMLSAVGIRGHEILFVMHRLGELGLICSYDLCTRNLHELYQHSGGLQFLTESLVSPRYLAGNVSLH